MSNPRVDCVGVVAAKANSVRFPDKNIQILRGEPLFWHSVKPLMESRYVDCVYVATDSEVIENYCNERGVAVIRRGVNVIYDEAPLLSVLKYAYQSINCKYAYVATIMANCPNHTAFELDNAIRLIKSKSLKEVRGFDKDGIETGLMVFDSTVIDTATAISSHIGSIVTGGTEIHYRDELKSLQT